MSDIRRKKGVCNAIRHTSVRLTTQKRGAVYDRHPTQKGTFMTDGRHKNPV